MTAPPLTPTEFLSPNELDAAKLVHFDQLNPQSQPKIVWPAAFPVARACGAWRQRPSDAVIRGTPNRT